MGNAADRRPKLPRIERPLSLVSRTERILREAIAQGLFPGNRLPPAADLAEELGVSRETVRLAQEALQREGLLVKIRRRGTLLEPHSLRLRAPEKARALAYLQTDYPSARGKEEAVTHTISGLMLQGALREAGRAGYELLLRHAPPAEMDEALERLLRTARLRGIIFASFGEEKLVRRALGLGVPVVLLDHELNHPRVGSVREDSFQGARAAVAHLAGLGHRRIAYAHWRREDLNPWRLRGYRQGLRDARLPRRRVWEMSVELTPAGAEQVIETLERLHPRPTALLCFNNTLAKLVVGGLRRRGVRVPGELSVMGGGGEPVAGLACHDADWFAMGRCAVATLLRAIRSRGASGPERRLFPHAVLPGSTAGPPGGVHPAVHGVLGDGRRGAGPLAGGGGPPCGSRRLSGADPPATLRS